MTRVSSGTAAAGTRGGRRWCRLQVERLPSVQGVGVGSTVTVAVTVGSGSVVPVGVAVGVSDGVSVASRSEPPWA